MSGFVETVLERCLFNCMIILEVADCGAGEKPILQNNRRYSYS